MCFLKTSTIIIIKQKTNQLYRLATRFIAFVMMLSTRPWQHYSAAGDLVVDSGTCAVESGGLPGKKCVILDCWTVLLRFD